MPLDIKPQKTKLQKTKDKIKDKLPALKRRSLEAMLTLLILVNIKVEMKLILALFIILYFLDRWGLIDKIFKNLEPKVILKEDENTSNTTTSS